MINEFLHSSPNVESIDYLPVHSDYLGEHSTPRPAVTHLSCTIQTGIQAGIHLLKSSDDADQSSMENVEYQFDRVFPNIRTLGFLIVPEYPGYKKSPEADEETTKALPKINQETKYIAKHIDSLHFDLMYYDTYYEELDQTAAPPPLDWTQFVLPETLDRLCIRDFHERSKLRSQNVVSFQRHG